MTREEFIGKLQMVYVGDRNAFNEIVCAYDGLLYRVDKAIEYTEKIEKLHFDYSYEKNKLLNILKGSDEE